MEKKILEQYVSHLKHIYGERLKKIILYGSYARGDFHAKSDVDIMILVDMTDLETRAYTDFLIEMTYDFNMEHHIDIQPYTKSLKQFSKWKHIDPFYANVSKEGVTLYEAA